MQSGQETGGGVRLSVTKRGGDGHQPAWEVGLDLQDVRAHGQVAAAFQGLGAREQTRFLICQGHKSVQSD